MTALFDGKRNKQVYVIFSVDTEHDIITKYQTKIAGWSEGIPLLFEAFDLASMREKVCWLIEYNLKENIVAANPSSVFFVENFRDLFNEMKGRGDELGIHPTMIDWLGGEGRISESLYNDANSWDFTRSYHDPVFVENLITSCVREFKMVCGADPIGCRTAGFHYAIHLANALRVNGIYIDSSVNIKLARRVTSPNAYYANLDNIYNRAPANTELLEIPATGYCLRGWRSFLLNAKNHILLRSRRPIFLSLYIHNWQSVTSDGKPDKKFLKYLSSFLRQLGDYGANFLTWEEANKKFKKIYGNNYGNPLEENPNRNVLGRIN